MTILIELSISTPALLFPAISLLLLAYTNRFITLANLVRDLYAKYKNSPSYILAGQIQNLKKRLIIIRNMQALGGLSFFLCVLCMFLIFAGSQLYADIVFGGSLILLMASLALSILEIQISVNALTLQLSDFENEYNKNKHRESIEE